MANSASIGRALADMLLTRSEHSAQRFYSIMAQIKAEQGKYYGYLEETQKGDLDITAHLDWLNRSFDGAGTILAGIVRKVRLWDLHAGNLSTTGRSQ